MLNTIRTAALLALLSALLMGIGFLLGGLSGILMGLVIAFALNFFSYWFSDKIVLKMQKARPYKGKEINSIVEKLAKKADIPKPKVYIVDSPSPNAFATGRNPENSAVAVTSGLIKTLNNSEIKGVLAHEISHIEHRDTLISTIAATIASAITYLGYMALFMAGRRNMVAALLTIILAPIAASLIQMAISRGREFHSDEGAAKLTGQPNSLASALNKISSHVKKMPMKGNDSAAHLFIVNPFKPSNMAKLFSTHPPIGERIQRLNKMEV